MRIKQAIIPLFVLLCTACNNNSNIPDIPSLSSPQVGKALPAWSAGNFDIHLINTGRGECCFYIMPDGTTLLVDAGEVQNDVLATPSTVPAHRVYAYYIKHFMPSETKVIDYCAPSHFHIDHIGGEDSVIGTAEAGYRKSGLMALFDYVPYRHIIDRAYPVYAEDETTPPIDGQLSQDWATFVTWGVENNKFTAERFEVGEYQIAMRNNPSRFPNFTIRNICANGLVLGKGSDGKEGIKGSKSTASGNICSCGFHVTYGKFDYIACGDLTGSPQNLVAHYFRDFIGNGNLEAFKCHHHLASNSWGSQMQAVNFNPMVALNHAFAANKPDHERLAYVLPIVDDFFATNIHPTISEAIPDTVAQIAGHSGHIVLRVKPGGDSFEVYILDDNNFDYKIKSIHGPYKSK